MVTALIVEDEPMIALDLEVTLQEFGFAAVVLAMTVEQALEILPGTRFDIALVDYRMGDKTAEPVLDMLDAQSIPAIIVTGYDDLAMTARAGRPVLGKPVVSAALRRAIADLGVL